VSAAAALEESWFLGLRRNAGVRLSALRSQFGAPPVEAYAPVLAGLAEGGLLSMDGELVSLTARGRLVSNEVFAALLEVDASGCIQMEIAARIVG
jgi:oxygen-independent coproporphyrinogen-3 oxidase